MNTREIIDIMSNRAGLDVTPWAARLRRAGLLPGSQNEMDDHCAALLLLAAMAAPDPRNAVDALNELHALKPAGLHGAVLPDIGIIKYSTALIGSRRAGENEFLPCGLAIRHGGSAAILYHQSYDGQLMGGLFIWGNRDGIVPAWSVIDHGVINALSGCRTADAQAVAADSVGASMAVH